MGSLVDVKKYMERDPHGRQCPMSEIKELTPEDRLDLIAEYDKLTDKEKGV